MSTMNFHLRLWKQKSKESAGEFVEIDAGRSPPSAPSLRCSIS